MSLGLLVQHSDQHGVVMSQPLCALKLDFLNNVKKQDVTMTTDPWLLGHVVLRHRQQEPGFCGKKKTQSYARKWPQISIFHSQRHRGERRLLPSPPKSATTACPSS